MLGLLPSLFVRGMPSPSSVDDTQANRMFKKKFAKRP
jgi:hypothetical protein